MNGKQLLAAYHDPAVSAKLAKVIYVDDLEHGWTRTKKGKKFVYADENGKGISEPAKVERANALRIPPAWKDVRIALQPKAHIQAVGFDVKGQKQYIYHADWNAFRQQLKYKRLSLFAEHLPKLRAHIAKSLEEKEPTRERAVAAALALIDALALRVGNEEYATENATYGVTTLRNRHITIKKDTIELNFVGKSHQEQTFILRDKKLAKALQKEKDIPGTRLFQFFDEGNTKHPLTSSEVNAFIKDSTGEEFTAKDFRTWSATAEAYKCMKDTCATLISEADEKEYKKMLQVIFKDVAKKLGNTVAVCRAHYVHAGLQELFLSGKFPETLKKQKELKRKRGLSTNEAELAALLASL